MSDQKYSGIHAERLGWSDCPSTRRENAFAAAWERENAHRSGGVLPLLVLTGPHDPFCPWGSQRTPAITITDEHERLVATVMQWLGTNVGFCFLERALKDAGYALTRTEPHA